MEPEHEADLHWQAFRYVAGEMSDDEVRRFEEQLADNQAAREAVTEAVQITQAVALTDTHEPVSLRPAAIVSGSRTRLLQPVVWMGFGAAVCLAIVLSAGWLSFSTDAPTASRTKSPGGTNPIVIADEEATELAMSWIETKDELAGQTDESQDTLIDLFDALEDETIAGEEVADEGDVEAETPSWLLLAVREEQGDPVTEEN